MFDFIKHSLNVKTSLFLTLFISTVFILLISISSSRQRESMLHQMDTNLTRTSELIHSAISKPMVVGDDETTKKEFKDLSDRYKDTDTFVTNYKGNITYSTQLNTVRKDISAIYKDPQLLKLKEKCLKQNESGSTIFQTGEKTFYAHAASIPNEPACHHCHGSSEPILGSMLLVQDISPVADGINRQLYETIALSAASVLLLLLSVIFFIKKTVISPINAIKHGTDRIASGDMNTTFPVSGQDELGQLCQNLNKMIERLRLVVAEVNCATTNVASGSSELSDSSNMIAQGATEQAASIEEISSSMEQMTSNIEDNTGNARKTEDISTQAASDAQKSGKEVHHTAGMMKNIAERIVIVEEIARQTNLLALNAAIEAARAGEHGKGFAVVASEVRKLAERSGIAAAEISDLSKSSVAVAEKAGDMLDKLVPEIQRTAELVQEIAASSEEQNSGASQINRAIQQLDHVVQQNASAAEEMASSAVELSGQGDRLKEAMSFFQVDEEYLQSCSALELDSKYTPPAINDDLTRY
jgi:methyl-accepting chemotaxis protein